MSEENDQPLVPDFTVTGFDEPTPLQSAAVEMQLKDVLALRMSTCVAANYNPSTNQICCNLPVYGIFCVAAPVPIPANAQLKVCAQTCGAIIPTGLRYTLYLNNSPISNGTVFGRC